MSDSMRDLIRDELAGWHIGSGYYLTTISVDEARDMADKVLAVLTDLPDDVIERAARELDPAAYNDLNATSIPRRRAAEAWMRKAFRAAFGINNYKENRK